MLGGIAFDILDRVLFVFFVCPGKLHLDIDRLGRSCVNLFILFIHSKLGMALCVNRSVRFRFYRFPIFCGLCVNDILEPHQQIRIKVSLGLEDDPSGAGIM